VYLTTTKDHDFFTRIKLTSMARVGRPLLFQDIGALSDKIDAYFAETKQEDWTITGLALSLDTSRATLINYEAKEDEEDGKEIAKLITNAKLKVEHSYELDLKRHGRTGTIFALKNFDWKDKTEVENKNFNLNKDIKDMSDDELYLLLNS